jgi:tetratricopeptide (TPR) repeat protein
LRVDADKSTNIENVGASMKKLSLLFVLISVLLISRNTSAEIKTYTYTVKQPFAGSQSADDARIAAIHKAKREVLEMAGTYLESMTIVKNNVVEKDEILALAAGVLKAEIVGEPAPFVDGNYFGITVIAKVDVDTSIMEQQVGKLLKDRTLLEKYNESQLREKELLEQIRNLEEQNKKLNDSSSKEGRVLIIRFKKATRGLSAVELNNKALALWNYGFFRDVSKAIEYLDQAIQADPDYGSAYNSLGLAHYSKGDYDLAIDNYEKAIDLNLKQLGPAHQNVAAAYNNLGLAYNSKGDHDEAIDYYNRALKILIKKLGATHENVATTYNNIGLAYTGKRDYDAAIQYNRKALEIDLEKLGPQHPDVARDYNNLGLAYRGKGEYDIAIDYYRKALDIELKKLGPEHPKVATSYNNIATAYYKKGDYGKAIDYYKKALEISRKKLGPEHPTTKLYQKNLNLVPR